MEQIRAEVPENIFTGVGIIVCDSLDELSFLPMNAYSKVDSQDNVISKIVEGSLATNVNHDGFNLLAHDFSLLYTNVFVSPPIVDNIDIDLNRGYGARYVTAALASKVKGIAMTAVVSISYGIVIFKDGKVVKFND
ncbi:hypothetical protein [Vibrio splendidus]|uniref:hypothetical protein n=1 Tax=Vibrio splendidus TaxID=29497 RepID=UPI00352D8F09